MEYAITEVIDNENNPVNSGRHITTDLWNFAMPFIRYDTQDIIEKSDKRSDSGIQLEAFRQIMGRDSDILVTPSGKYLIVHTFTIFFEYFEEIIQFQVIQNNAESVEVHLVVKNGYNKKTETEIAEGLAGLLGKEFHIAIHVVTKIPLLPSGKRKFIVRDKSVKLPFQSNSET